MVNLLMATSAAIVGLLGLAHLVLTYRGPKLRPRDRALREAMDRDSPVITRKTTMWRAWVGFNASHSMGAILFGLVYGYLATCQSDLLFESLFLQSVGLAMLIGYVVLAKLYWFVSPLAGTSLSLACYVLSIGLSWAQRSGASS